MQLQNVRRAGVPVLQPDDDGKIASEEILDPFVFQPNEKVYLKGCLRTDCLRSWNTRRRVDADAHEAIDAEVPKTVKDEHVLLSASKSAPFSLSPPVTFSFILSEAQKTYKDKYDCPFHDFPDTLEMDGVSLEDQVDLALTDPAYNVPRALGRSGVDYERLTLDDMAETAMLCKWVMKAEAHGHFFCIHGRFSA